MIRASLRAITVSRKGALAYVGCWTTIFWILARYSRAAGCSRRPVGAPGGPEAKPFARWPKRRKRVEKLVQLESHYLRCAPLPAYDKTTRSSLGDTRPRGAEQRGSGAPEVARERGGVRPPSVFFQQQLKLHPALSARARETFHPRPGGPSAVNRDWASAVPCTNQRYC